MDKILGSLKAIVAGAASVTSVVAVAVADQTLSLTEGKTVLAAVLAALASVAAVWATPNK